MRDAMHVTIEQARAFDALARHGTYQRAAKALRKAHTALVYAIQSLEEQTELELLDRRGYRTKLTPAGERVLEQCRKLLACERELASVCAEIKTGWEPTLRVVFDGVFPAEPILRLVGQLRREGAPTRFQITAEFLEGVERTFVQGEMDAMIAVLPATTPGVRSMKLPALRARLVAHKGHPLAKQHRLTRDDLAAHVLITVRGSDPRLQLATSQLDATSSVQLHDFAAKKAAILQGIGFGWLPDHLIARELRKGDLVALPLDKGSTHTFSPMLHVRESGHAGRATQRLIDELRGV
jgi:DNA-binding transcriptional LysR family regulator